VGVIDIAVTGRSRGVLVAGELHGAVFGADVAEPILQVKAGFVPGSNYQLPDKPPLTTAAQ
jgi:hypothetical protein